MRGVMWYGDKRGLFILERLLGGVRPEPGLLVLAGGQYPPRPRRAPRLALFEGRDAAAARMIAGSGAVAVTVGMSGCDCVTFSSLAPDGCALCVCREFPSLRGAAVQEGELIVRCATPGLPELFACAAALALGVDVTRRDIV